MLGLNLLVEHGHVLFALPNVSLAALKLGGFLLKNAFVFFDFLLDALYLLRGLLGALLRPCRRHLRVLEVSLQLVVQVRELLDLFQALRLRRPLLLLLLLELVPFEANEIKLVNGVGHLQELVVAHVHVSVRGHPGDVRGRPIRLVQVPRRTIRSLRGL